MSKRLKTILIWVGLIAVFFVFFSLQHGREPLGFESFETFLKNVDEDLVTSIRVHNNEITVHLVDEMPSYKTLGAVTDEITQLVSDNGGIVEWGEESHPFRTWLIIALPVLFVLLFIWYFAKRVNSTQSGIFSLGKSRARLVSNDSAITFDDVAGCDEAKEQLGDMIDFLVQPKRWTKAGARLPRGILLDGPPGCGKTLLARAVAGETKAKFYTVSASEFVELFVGVGAARVRDMFEIAAKNTPAVIFIDELDAVGRRRGSGIGAGHDEREQTLNQILVSLDGFERTDTLVVIAATNRSDILDPALMRPGRFDRHITVPPLSREARCHALEIHTRNKSLADEVSLQNLAELTDGMTGAQIESVTNEASLLAVRRARQANDTSAIIRREDLLKALEPVLAAGQSFDQLDTVLIDSMAQLARPKGRAVARITLENSSEIVGEVVWADGTFIKIHNPTDATDVIVAKQRIHSIEALPGTEMADGGHVPGQSTARETSGLA